MSSDSSVSRRPPAFQIYASDLLASAEFMDATLAERGLLLTMLLRAWLDDRLPADPAKLSRRLFLQVDEVRDATGALVRAHFNESATAEVGYLAAPDLVRQMGRHEETSRKKSEAGRLGGLKTQSENRLRSSTGELSDQSSGSSSASNTASSTAKASAKAPELKRTELNREEKKGKQGEADEEWLAAFEGREASSGFEVKL